MVWFWGVEVKLIFLLLNWAFKEPCVTLGEKKREYRADASYADTDVTKMMAWDHEIAGKVSELRNS